MEVMDLILLETMIMVNYLKMLLLEIDILHWMLLWVTLF